MHHKIINPFTDDVIRAKLNQLLEVGEMPATKREPAINVDEADSNDLASDNNEFRLAFAVLVNSMHVNRLMFIGIE